MSLSLFSELWILVDFMLVAMLKYIYNALMFLTVKRELDPQVALLVELQYLRVVRRIEYRHLIERL